MFNLNYRPEIGRVSGGAMGVSDVTALRKAMEADYGTEMTGLTGGGALRIQSLDKTLKATVQGPNHFVLFRNLRKSTATAVEDEWTEQDSIGGFFGSGFNTQSGAAPETYGNYQRRVAQVKYLNTYRQIPLILDRQNNLADPITLETMNGARELLSTIEWSLFEGDPSVVPTAFPGIAFQMEDLRSVDHVIDLNGGPLNKIDAISQASKVAWSFGNFGQISDAYLSAAVQGDLNIGLDPAFRIALDNSPNSVALGTHVSKIQTSWGAISTSNDVFIRDEEQMVPFEIRDRVHTRIAAKNDFKPASVTLAPATGEADSKWSASRAGAYKYFVSGLNQDGESNGVWATGGAVTVAAGGAVVITITASTSRAETGYVIYRGRQDVDATDLKDLREMIRIPANDSGTTVYRDICRAIPGSTKAYFLDMVEGNDAIDWREFLPMTRIPMAATNSAIIPWLQMIAGYLRITKRRHHVLVKNIVPKGYRWRPFTNE